MREAILRVDRRGLLWTISRMFSRVFIVRTTSLWLHRNTRKRTSITQCLVNSHKYTSRPNPSIEKTPLVFFNSSTCIAIAKSIHRMHITIFHVWKHKRHFSNSAQLTYQPFTTRPQHTLKKAHMHLTASVSWLSVIGHHTQGQTSIRLVSWQVQYVDPPEDHTFLWPLSS